MHSVAEKMRLSEPNTKKWNEDMPTLSAAEMKANDCSFYNIRFVRIFAGLLWRRGVKRQWGN